MKTAFITGVTGQDGSLLAEKCERLGTASPVAWIAASSPDAHNGSKGFIIGCSPNIASAQSSALAWMAVDGRTW